MVSSSLPFSSLFSESIADPIRDGDRSIAKDKPKGDITSQI
jgi:hypothetical protein